MSQRAAGDWWIHEATRSIRDFGSWLVTNELISDSPAGG